MYKLGSTPSPNHGVIITATGVHLLRRRIVNLGGGWLKNVCNLDHVGGFKELWVRPVLSKAYPYGYAVCFSNGNGNQHPCGGQCVVNCYSLNSIGPTMESFSGPKRYVTVYFASAIASSVMSYRLCRDPSVGAIFGLVGSVAVFALRHRGLVGGGKGIDNWGHVGGLVGGVASSYLVGPAWKYESVSNDGRRVFADKAPIKYLFNRIKKPPSPLN